MPGVLKWLNNKLNCSSDVAGLLAATASGDVDIVRAIIKSSPEAGVFNSAGGGRSALTLAAERGDLEILRIIYEGAIRAQGEAFAKQSLNAGADRGQTPLMRACVFGSVQHVECVTYLLSKGADPFGETDKGETCLHLAAKNANTDCLRELLVSWVAVGGAPATRLADALLPYTPPVKFVDMRNAAGFTALHLAALKNSPTTLQVLLAAGASMEAGISDAGNTPHLAKGSTALHIAAARGSQPCCSVLLDFQAGVPGIDLRRIRNQRGLKASQLARLAGHETLARLLSEGRRREGSRRHRRTRDALNTRSNRTTNSPDAVMAALVQRAKLLLSLREIGLELDEQAVLDEEEWGVPDKPSKKKRNSTSADVQDEVAAAVAEFTELWKKGEGIGGSNSLLSQLIPADMPVAKLPDEILGDGENAGEESYAAAAMVQAALNAMTYYSPTAKPLHMAPTELKPTSPIAAAMVVQAAIRKLAGKSANLTMSTAAHTGAQSPHTVRTITPNGTHQPESIRVRSRSRGRPREGARARGSANPQQLRSLPAQPAAEEGADLSTDGGAGEAARTIVHNVRKRQQRMRGTETHEMEPSKQSAHQLAARSTSPPPGEEIGHNPLMESPLVSSPGETAMLPGERRRAALRSQALQTRPGSLSTSSPLSIDSHTPLDPPTPPPAVPAAAFDVEPVRQAPIPMFDPEGASSSAAPAWDAEPPFRPPESPEGPPPLPIRFSDKMPKAAFGRKGVAAARRSTPTESAGPSAAPTSPPRTPPRSPARTRPSEPANRVRERGSRGSPGKASIQEPHAALASTSEDADNGPMSSAVSQTDSLGCASSARRAPKESSECLSTVTRGSHSSRLPHDVSDSSEAATPVATPQPSQKSLMLTSPQASLHNSDVLFTADTDDHGDTDRERDSESEDSCEEAKDELDLLHKAEVEKTRCAICMDQPLQVGIATCEHKVCFACAYQLCARGLSQPLCPFCRGHIKTFLSAAVE